MQFVKSPRPANGRFRCAIGGVRRAYETGRGRLGDAGRVHTEQIGGSEALVSPIPYGIKLSTIIESIGKADRDGHITGISKMHGGTVKEGIQQLLVLKRGEDPEIVLNQLWKHTYLQYGFGINMIALDGGRPRTVGLKRMLQAWLTHRQEVIVRRTRLLERDEALAHIVLGLLHAIDIIDEIIALIRFSFDRRSPPAIDGPIRVFERQAQAILISAAATINRP